MSKNRTKISLFSNPNTNLFIEKQTQQKYYHKRNNSSSSLAPTITNDPIAQTSDFFLNQSKPWRPSTKKNSLWNTTTQLTKASKDELIHSRNAGLFNDKQRAIKDDVNWRSSLIKSNLYYTKPTYDSQVDAKRGTMRVEEAYKNTNPILQTGDNIQKIEENKKIRYEIKPSDLYTQMMQRKRRNYENEPTKG